MKQEKIDRVYSLLFDKYSEDNIPNLSIIQLVGDRDNPSISIKEVAFTIPANPMSDRGQMVLERLVLESEEDMDKLIQVGVLDGKKHEQSARIYSEDGICPTIMAGSRKACTGGYIAPKILIKNNKNKLNSKIKTKGDYSMEKLRVFEAFCGYGSQSIALENIGVPHEVVAISDIDADVLVSYGAIRGDLDKQIDLSDDEIKEWLMARNIGWDFQKQKSSIPRMKKDKLYKLYNSCIQNNCLGDVSIIDPDVIPDHDLFTYSFPCTDISVAGQMKGLTRDSGTRSGLLWECEKIIAAKKPKYLLMENVKNLVGKQFKPEFDKWCEWLEEQGYKNFYKVLNAKDYGIPQNRERVFMISILDTNTTYEFPEKFPLELRLKDILEDVVDEKYYIDNDASNRLLKALEEKGYTKNMIGIANNPDSREFHDFKECSPTLCARDYKDPKIVQMPCDATINNPKPLEVANCITARYDSGIQNRQSVGVSVCEQRCDEGLRFFKDDVCGTIRTIDAGGDKRVIEKNYESPVRLGNIYGEDKGTGFAGNVWDKENVCPTLTTMQGGNRQPMTLSNYRIRKLTPKECWRLMGMKDVDFDKCVDVGLSNSQLYKQAGNSIVVDVLEYIFRELFKQYIVSSDTENFTQPQEN